MAALLAGSALAALLGWRLYPHYFIPLYFPLALAAAPWAAEHVRLPLSRAARVFVGWTAVLLAGFTAANGYLYVVRHDVYTETRLRPASRFLLVGSSLVGYVPDKRDPAADEGLVRPQHWDWLLSNLAARRPTYVLDTARARLGRWGFPLEANHRLAAFVAASYEPLDVVDGVRLYRRRGCGPP